MIIISDCFKNKTDEGCIKVASSLAKRMKNSGAEIVSINTQCVFADASVRTNRLLLSKNLFRRIRRHNGDVLYIPFASNTLGSAIRTVFLTLFSRRRVTVIFALYWEMNVLTKLLFRSSKCRVLLLSHDSYEKAKIDMCENEVCLISTGVDTKKFLPVSLEKKNELKMKYGLPLDKIIVMHAGHLKTGRNVEALLDLDEEYFFCVLAISSVTEVNAELRRKFKNKSNVLFLEEYIEHIEEIYQASDVYMFPLIEENNSIDIPISVLEAASCNIGIISTPYKEVKYFETTEGLVVKDYNREAFSDSMQRITKLKSIETRKIALKYDWELSINSIESMIG